MAARSLPVALRGKFVMEVFSGSGRLARSFAELGVPGLMWDIDHGPAGDLLNDDVLAGVLAHIASGNCLFLWLGTPCPCGIRLTWRVSQDSGPRTVPKLPRVTGYLMFRFCFSAVRTHRGFQR